MKSKQMMGIVGFVLVFLGVFAPVHSLPILGNVGYIAKWNIAGVLALALSAATLVFSLLDKCRFLWGTGTGILVLVGITFMFTIAEGRSGIQWGWLLLFTGGLLIIGVALYEEIERRS